MALVLAGSVLFALGFALTTIAFSYYVARFASYDKTYGSLGAVIILLLWMYLVGLILLLGGEVNAYLDRAAAELRPRACRRAGARRRAGRSRSAALDARPERTADDAGALAPPERERFGEPAALLGALSRVQIGMVLLQEPPPGGEELRCAWSCAAASRC